MDNQQGPAVQYMYNSMLCSSLDGKGVWEKMIYMYVCVAKSLHYSLETITTLSLSYTPVQDKKFFSKKEQSAEHGVIINHL